MNAAFATEVVTACCVQLTLIVMVTVGLQRWLGDARVTCRLWTTCFLSLLALLAAAMLLPHRRWLAFPESLSHQSVLQIVSWQSSLVAGLLAVWLTGVTVSLLRRGIRCLQLLRFLRTGCQVLTAEQVQALPLAREASPGNLQIMTSQMIQGPFCWQLHRPVIVLPDYVLQQDATTLRHVLRHELEHLRTHHPMQHFLQGVCSTLFWFHPAVWLAAGRAELTREFLCDEVAAVELGQFAAYLRTLVTIAEHCDRGGSHQVPAAALAFGNRKSALIQRSDRLVQLANQTTPRQVSRWRGALAVMALVLTTVVVSQIWLPTNAMASNRRAWSPWPRWTASVLHSLDVKVRDYEPFEQRTDLHELLENAPS